GRDHLGLAGPPDRAAWDRPGPAGAAHLRAPHRPREPPPRGPPGTVLARPRPRPLPSPRRAPRAAGRHALGRGAADARHRPGAPHQRTPAPPGRALRGAGPPDRPGDRADRATAPRGGAGHPPRRAELRAGRGGRRPRVGDEQGTDRLRRHAGRPRRPRGGQAPLSRCGVSGMPQSFRIGFDVGGTFTDFALQDDAGRLLTAKRLTTPDDPARACVEGLRDLVAAAGLRWEGLAQAVHGTTLGSNVLIQRKGRNGALLTTNGFPDVLLIGREKRYQLYDLFIEKPVPLVPRSRIREVTERVAFDGAVLTPLDEAGLRRTLRGLAAEGIVALAVCLLHAYTNPAHERRVAE